MPKRILTSPQYQRIYAVSQSSVTRWIKAGLPLDSPAEMWTILQSKKHMPRRTEQKGITRICADYIDAVRAQQPICEQMREIALRLIDTHGALGALILSSPASELSEGLQRCRVAMLPAIGEMEELIDPVADDDDEDVDSADLA